MPRQRRQAGGGGQAGKWRETRAFLEIVAYGERKHCPLPPQALSLRRGGAKNALDGNESFAALVAWMDAAIDFNPDETFGALPLPGERAGVRVDVFLFYSWVRSHSMRQWGT
jgi:hypothetical protein